MERLEEWVATGRMSRAEWMNIYEAEEAVEEAQGMAAFRNLRPAETVWVQDSFDDDDGDHDDRPPPPPPGGLFQRSNRSTSGKKTSGKTQNSTRSANSPLRQSGVNLQPSQHCSPAESTQCESPIQVAASSFPGPYYKVAEEADGHTSSLLPVDRPPSSPSIFHELHDAQRRSPSPLPNCSPHVERRLAGQVMVLSSDDEESRMSNPTQFSLSNINEMRPHCIVEQVREFPMRAMPIYYNAAPGMPKNKRRLTLLWSPDPNSLQQPVLESGQGFQINSRNRSQHVSVREVVHNFLLADLRSMFRVTVI